MGLKKAKLRINVGETVNMGNYESRRQDISLEIEIDEKDFEFEASELDKRLKKALKLFLER